MPRPQRTAQRQRPEKIKPQIVEERGFKTLAVAAEHVAELEYTPSQANGTSRRRR